MQVSRFNHDRFEKVDVFSLVAGDQVNVFDQFLTVVAPPYLKDGEIHLPAEPVNQPIILVDISDNAASRAMDYVGSSIHDFGDGTAIIAELDGSSDLVYSPRLLKAQLEAFCEKHLERYRAFYTANSDAIEDGRKLSMASWWDSGVRTGESYDGVVGLDPVHGSDI